MRCSWPRAESTRCSSRVAACSISSGTGAPPAATHRALSAKAQRSVRRNTFQVRSEQDGKTGRPEEPLRIWRATARSRRASRTLARDMVKEGTSLHVERCKGTVAAPLGKLRVLLARDTNRRSFKDISEAPRWRRIRAALGGSSCL